MSLEVTEGGSSTSYTVALATQPTGTVTMTITSDDVGAVTATPSPLTFDATNWSTAKTVTVNSVVDSDTEHEEVVINHEASGGGYNEVTGTIETAVTDVTVPGAWSYETVVEPSTITAGGGVAATTTLRAKFQADQGNLSSLSARVTTGGKLFVQLYNTQLPHIGWATAADSYDDATALKVETTSDPPDRTADVSAGTLVCETTFDGEVLYAKSTANSGDNNVRLGVDTNFTYTAVVNGMDSTISVASGRSALAGVLVVLSMPLTTDLAATAGDTEVVLSWPDPSDSSIIKYQLLQLQEAKLTASDGAASDNFGYSVAVAGDTAVVGAYGDGSQSGSAYVFTRGGSGVWSQTAKLTAADGAANDQFGYSVAVAGAYEDDDRGGASGSAYVFVKPAAGWATGTQTAKLTASDGTTTDYFGISVAVDGDTAVVGAHFDDDNGSKSGSAYAFGIQNWTDIRGSGAATTSHTVSGLTNGTEYTFRIRAVNASGNGEASDSVDTTPAGPPLAPADFTATGGDMSATLEWEAVDANGSPITKYQYQQKEDAGSVANWTDIPGSGAATTSHTVTGLTAGIVYTFRLRAVNGVGEGAESDEQTVTLPLAKPAGLTATAGHLQVTLAWNDPSDTTITGYQSQQTTATTTDAGSTVGDFSGLGWTDILDANAGTTSHIVTGLTNRVTYYFKVRAGNPSGPGGATMYSAGSDPASATAALGPPNVPGRLTAKPGNGMVVLSWDDPDDSTIIRYEYRQADTYQTGDPVWPTDPTDNSEVWTRITASGADTTTHTVTGLDNDRTNQGDEDDVLYTFQVRAVNYAINRITWQLGVASDAVKANPGLPIDGPTGLTGSFDPETGKIVLEWDQHADYPGAEFAVNWHYNRVQAQRTGSFDGGFLVGPAVTDADGNAILPQRPATGTEVDIGAEFGVYDFVVAARSNFGPWSLTAATTSVTTSPFLDQPDATREVDKQAGAGSSVGKPVETRTPSGYDVRLSIDAPNGDFAIDSATGQITVTGGSRAPGAYPVAVTATVRETLALGMPVRTYSINLTINVTSRGPWTQQGKLTASDGVAEDSLGYAVAVDEASGTIVVGAKDHNGRVGAVYVYDGYDDDTPAKLTSPTTNAGEQFGYTVAIDGDTIVVGSTEADTTPGSGFPPTAVRTRQGTVYVFTKAADVDWAHSSTPTASLTSDESALLDGFGESVAINGDTIVVGARYRTPDALEFAGAAYVFVKPDTGWANGTQTARLEAPVPAAGAAFGTSVAYDGSHVVIGAPGDDRVYVFTRPGDAWADADAPAAALTEPAGSLFGSSVSIESGNIAIGAPTAGTGAVYVYSGSGPSWSQSARLAGLGADDGDGFGLSVAVSGDNIAVGRYNQADNDLAGSVQVFEKRGSRWTSSIVPHVLTPQQGLSGDQFGSSVALAGNTLVVGATGVGGMGAAYVLEQTQSQGATRPGTTGPGTTGNTGSQPVTEVLPDVPTRVETPSGNLVLEIEAANPIQVSLNDDVAGCESPVAGGATQSCVSVEIVASGGGSATGAVRSAEMSIAVVGTGERIALYKRANAEAPWVRIPSCDDSPTSECFAIAPNDGGGPTITVRNIASFSQYVVVQLPASVTTGDGTATVVRRRRAGGGIARATATPAPVPTQAAVQPTAAPQPTSIAPTATPPTLALTPVGASAVGGTGVQPAPESTPVAAEAASPTPTLTPADTPEPVAAIPNTPVPAATTAVPPAVEPGRGFPLWLIAAIVVAVLVAGGLGFGAWRMLRPQ